MQNKSKFKKQIRTKIDKISELEIHAISIISCLFISARRALVLLFVIKRDEIGCLRRDEDLDRMNPSQKKKKKKKRHSPKESN